MTLQKTFFSYSRDDSEFVLKLAKDLRTEGANIWLDQLDIPAGKRWDAEIEQALESAQVQLVILSPSSVGSNNVMDEVSYALEKGKHVVPILLIDCQIPFRLKRLQYINFTSSYDTGFNQLLRALNLEKIAGKETDSKIFAKGEPEKSGEKLTSIQETQKQKLESESEQKRKEQIKQDTKTRSPLGESTSAYDSGSKKSPLKLIVAVAAVVIVVVLTIIVITNMGSDENATSPSQDSVLVDTEPLENNSNEESTETVKEEPISEVDYTSDYYEYDNGAFQREGNQWIEYTGDQLTASFTYEETDRDADYIYIQDASRGISLALPTVDGYCLLLDNNESGEPEWQQLYYLRISK
jgi:TIR domain